MLSVLLKPMKDLYGDKVVACCVPSVTVVELAVKGWNFKRPLFPSSPAPPDKSVNCCNKV